MNRVSAPIFQNIISAA